MCGGNPIRNIFRAVETIQPGQIVRERIPQERTPVQPLPRQQSVCPTCGAQVDASFSWCPSCGAALKPESCAYCGQTLDPGDTVCSFCGAPRARKPI